MLSVHSAALQQHIDLSIINSESVLESCRARVHGEMRMCAVSGSN